MMISAIHQIEMTSRCNLACRYCAHPSMQRDKIHMDGPTYRRALAVAASFVKRGTQFELNLAGIGESTMHPDFVRNVALAREAVGWQTRIVLATNGLLLTDEMAREIAPYRPAVYVSLHRPERAGPAVEAARRHGILHGTSTDAATAAIDWAGQVKWHVSAPPDRVCQWLSMGRVAVLADGRVSRCCLDASGIGVLGTIWDDFDTMNTSPYPLCGSCDQAMPAGVARPTLELVSVQ